MRSRMYGNWKGLDVSLCLAVAAAVLGDAHKVRFVGATSADRLTLLQSGQIDLLVRDTTQTFVRNNRCIWRSPPSIFILARCSW